MKKWMSLGAALCLAVLMSLVPSGVSKADPMSAELWAASWAEAGTSNTKACWGQASRVFARMGMMGVHASQEETPRLGLRNLARALYEMGVLPDDSLQSLGRFVADELGLSIDACM